MDTCPKCAERDAKRLDVTHHEYWMAVTSLMLIVAFIAFGAVATARQWQTSAPTMVTSER
jgi:hypothetical protein